MGDGTAAWVEDQHPRDDRGRFAESAGGGALGKWAAREAGSGGGPGSARDVAEAPALPKDVVDQFRGKLPPGHTDAEHVAIAREFLGKHEAALEGSLAELREIAPKDAQVTGRTKDLASALIKLVRKPKYESVDKLQDGTGMRVVCKDLDDVRKTVDAIKAKYKVVGEDDYIAKPINDGYRSYHLTVREGGLDKEIQVRTRNEDQFANWAHDAVYKPHSKEQAETMKKNAGTIASYSTSMSAYLYASDRGVRGDKPPCPEVIKVSFGCL